MINKNTVILIIMMIGAMPAFALETVEASGDTIDATPFLTTLATTSTSDKDAALAAVQSEDMIQPNKALFPLTSQLTPGHISAHRIHVPALTTPIFIVGDDSLSQIWLAQHKSQLQALHAQGIITNVPDEATWKQMEAQSGMTLLPASLDDLSGLFPTQHYPCLISQYWVEQ